MNEEKIKIKILRAPCRCSGCQEIGRVLFAEEYPDEVLWCQAFEVISEWDLWEDIVRMLRANDKYEIVEDTATNIK